MEIRGRCCDWRQGNELFRLDSYGKGAVSRGGEKCLEGGMELRGDRDAGLHCGQVEALSKRGWEMQKGRWGTYD